MYKRFLFFALFCLWASLSYGYSQEPGKCQTVHFSEPGWTDIAATTAVASQVLHGLGYKTESRFLSVPFTYAALSMGEVDVFLGYWKPSMSPILRPYEENKSVETVRFNLRGAKYSLAVPKFAYDEGLKSFKDISKYSNRLGSRIYGVEPGNDGNRIILSMIKNGSDNLGSFRLVESSEQAMLSEIAVRIAAHEPIVFLGWEPHPMNARFQIAYLSDGDAFFGPNYGAAMVGTNTRKGYIQECANVGRFLLNLEFSLFMENELMNKIVDEGQDPEKAANLWLRRNMNVLPVWLKDVKTWNGSDGLSAVRNFLSLK
ncbi:MAG: glycine betaine/proline transport system substrate-binding protein [Candidatus Tokpelaia sp. JSC161]|nr:MAG: glycine betaine/proline transport system substrate-binding protein [Candidatus Tokpelaia sp. JSC161]